VVDEDTSVEICLVAEAADLLDQHQAVGVYFAAGFFYYRDGRGDTVMFYGTHLRVVHVACLPPHATAVELPPREITAAVVGMEIAG
jgi:hypothetical protein